MGWLKNMGVGRKISLGFALLALLMVFTIVIALSRINSVAGDQYQSI